MSTIKTTKKYNDQNYHNKNMLRPIAFMRCVFVVIVLFCAFAFSQERGSRRDKVNFGGQAEIGFSYEAVGGLGGRAIMDDRVRRIGVVELELKILPADSVELEFDLEFDHRYTDATLKKLFVRYNFDNSNARLGYMKKMFTLEEIQNSRNRLFIRKSMLNDILEEFFILGHELTAQYRYNFPSYTFIGAYTTDGSFRNFLNMTLRGNLSPRVRGTAAAMYQLYFIDEDYNMNHAFFGNAGLEFDGRVTDFEVEAVWGNNLENDVGVHVVEWEYGASVDNIWGLRFQQSFPIDINRERLNTIIPFYEVSYFNDSFSWNRAYWQTRAGINFGFTKRNRLQWRTNVEMTATERNQNSSRPRIISERVLSEILVLW